MQLMNLAEPLPKRHALKKRRPTWLVRYGPMEWRRFTYDRTPEGDLQLLGSIRKGLQAGALARTRDGHYVLLVGDHETPLNSSQMDKALKSIPSEYLAPVAIVPQRTSVASMPAPVVTVKKRRVIVPD